MDAIKKYLSGLIRAVFRGSELLVHISNLLDTIADTARAAINWFTTMLRAIAGKSS